MMTSAQPAQLSNTCWAMTGGIACGKSSVAAIMETSGWAVVDSDRIAREVVEPGQEGYQIVVDAFGTSILKEDRSINRGRLRHMVFSDPIQRNHLNSLLHPLIKKRWQDELEIIFRREPGRPVVVVIPLLYEAGFDGDFLNVVAVGCSLELQRIRLAGRGLSEEMLEGMIDSQMPVAEKCRRAGRVIWNDGSLELLKGQVNRLLEQP
ncbi:MAG: dephospho-CoA kinase [Candidatus Methylacidiphilales bacterium]